MPFVVNKITATTSDEYQRCLDAIAHVNTMIQTLNGKNVRVNITVQIVPGCFTMRPDWGKINELRIVPDAAKDFWIDCNHDKGEISIRPKPQTVYVIALEAEKEKI